MEGGRDERCGLNSALRQDSPAKASAPSPAQTHLWKIPRNLLATLAAGCQLLRHERQAPGRKQTGPRRQDIAECVRCPACRLPAGLSVSLDRIGVLTKYKIIEMATEAREAVKLEKGDILIYPEIIY
jgi:hypothetical protein